MLSETLSIDRYSQIDWSREKQQEDGKPNYTFGLIGISIGPNGWWVNNQGLLIPHNTPGQTNSVIVLGYVGEPRTWVCSRADRSFDLADSARINKAVTLTLDLLIMERQMRSAGKAIQYARALVNSLITSDVKADPEIRKGAREIMQVVQTQERKCSTTKLVVTATSLAEIGVEQIDTLTSLTDGKRLRTFYWPGPGWLIKYSDQEQIIIV